ncbi:hypothetical protein DPEC_G00036870 [Dallia pectoralis]|uniref:Uncharacterized protein n=1 Tax=Dallia pectoralis TaxID=75939 RepID=A0ACC2HEE0_DALPE|nr:hypothetical protein DPEC_G00036870 [Dallia pectoralis]
MSTAAESVLRTLKYPRATAPPRRLSAEITEEFGGLLLEGREESTAQSNRECYSTGTDNHTPEVRAEATRCLGRHTHVEPELGPRYGLRVGSVWVRDAVRVVCGHTIKDVSAAPEEDRPGHTVSAVCGPPSNHSSHPSPGLADKDGFSESS